MEHPCSVDAAEREVRIILPVGTPAEAPDGVANAHLVGRRTLDRDDQEVGHAGWKLPKLAQDHTCNGRRVRGTPKPGDLGIERTPGAVGQREVGSPGTAVGLEGQLEAPVLERYPSECQLGADIAHGCLIGHAAELLADLRPMGNDERRESRRAREPLGELRRERCTGSGTRNVTRDSFG